MKLALLLLVVTVAIAHADAKDDARAHVATADTAFKLGHFDDALAEYEKAYELFPAPALLFNLGQCHRNLRHWERAVFFFEGYLRERPDAPNRAVTEDLIREAQAELDKQNASDAEQKARDAEAARKRADAEAEQRRLDAEAERHRLDLQAQAAITRRIEPPPPAPDETPLVRKWWFWSAVGVAAIAVGGTAYYFSGGTTIVEPSGSLGGLDRR
jgi:tetratricopeptide (TPR) repeat protein